MHFAEYYHYDLAGKLSPACGSEGVVILDGRRSMAGLHADARQCNGWRRKTYAGYRLFRGETFTRSRAISELVMLKQERVER